jgi:hypothetical protein
MSFTSPVHRALRQVSRWIRTRFHPSRDALQLFVLGDLPPAETSRVFEHLLLGCERCRAFTASLWTIGESAEGCPIEYEPSLERVFSAARRALEELETGRGVAERLAAELEELPAEKRCSAAREDPRYRSPALCELLLRRSRESLDDSPRAGLLGELAVAVAEGLGTESGRPSLANEDLQAAAWANLAGARRRLPDFPGAEEALAAARRHLARGTNDRLEKAWLLDLEASLREDQGRAEEASRLRSRAQALYRRTEEEERAVTLQSPATISPNPSPSNQPNRSPRKVAANTAATNGCNVL